eukprot:652670-Ditylum_brightwellii.AAC.1
MTKTRANATSKQTAKDKAKNRKKKEMQEAKDRKDTKEKRMKRKEGHGPDKAAAVMGSTAKTDVAPSQGRRPRKCILLRQFFSPRNHEKNAAKACHRRTPPLEEARVVLEDEKTPGTDVNS